MNTNELYKRVTVIIPYKEDRGWLKDAINSVPEGVQLILSKGDGNWPKNFNKSLPQATGEFIKFLHEDDMLTPGSIEDSVNGIEEQGVDFIHGNALEIWEGANRQRLYTPKILKPSFSQLLGLNVFHCPTLMYRRSIFEKLGGLDESAETDGFEELEFNLRCLKNGFKVGYIDATLAIYRRHPKQKIRLMTADTTKSFERAMRRKQLINKFA